AIERVVLGLLAAFGDRLAHEDRLEKIARIGVIDDPAGEAHFHGLRSTRHREILREDDDLHLDPNADLRGVVLKQLRPSNRALAREVLDRLGIATLAGLRIVGISTLRHELERPSIVVDLTRIVRIVSWNSRWKEMPGDDATSLEVLLQVGSIDGARNGLPDGF